MINKIININIKINRHIPNRNVKLAFIHGKSYVDNTLLLMEFAVKTAVKSGGHFAGGVLHHRKL